MVSYNDYIVVSYMIDILHLQTREKTYRTDLNNLSTQLYCTNAANLEYDTININGKQNVRLEFAHFSHTLHNDLWHCLKFGGFQEGRGF